MTPFGPFSMILLWFFSQNALIYFVFVPLSAICFFLGMMELLRPERSRR